MIEPRRTPRERAFGRLAALAGQVDAPRTKAAAHIAAAICGLVDICAAVEKRDGDAILNHVERIADQLSQAQNALLDKTTEH